MWAWLYLPKGRVKYERLDYWATDVAAIMHGLALEQFNGYVEILSTHQHGLFIFYNGGVVNCFYEGEEDLQLKPEEILDYFIQKKQPKVQTIINAMELDPRIIEALSALEARKPLYSELEVNFLDMDKMFETLKAKRFTGVLRFYHIRSHPRLGNILLKMNKISREQLQDAVRLQLSHKGSLRLGDALVQINAIKPADIENALNLQSHARKGSDIEVAIAVFHRGGFLGGYSHTHKNFERSRAEILPQLVGTEVLLDIIEGELPRTVDLGPPLQRAGFPVADAPAPAGEIRPAAPAPAAAAEDQMDTLQLSADDLIEEAPAGNPPVSRPAEPPEQPPPALAADWATEPAAGQPATRAGSARPALRSHPPSRAAKIKTHQNLQKQPEPVDTENAAVAKAAAPAADKTAGAPAAAAKAPEPAAPAPAVPEAAPAPLPPLEHLHAVAEKFLGPLGRRLLGKEIQALGIESTAMGPEQLASLSERLVAASRLIIGKTQAQKMRQAVAERLGLTP